MNQFTQNAQTLGNGSTVDLAFVSDRLAAGYLDFLALVIDCFAGFAFQGFDAGLQLLGAAEDLGEEVLDSSDGLGHSVLDCLPDLLDGFLDAFHRNGGGSGLARGTAEGFQGRSNGADLQAQTSGVGTNGVLHEQRSLRVQTAVLHGSFHRNEDGLQAVGDFFQFALVVASLLGFREGFGGFGNFLLNGVVRAHDQVGFVDGVVFHGDEQLTQRLRHVE
ncbi:hypothetical protein D3C78_1027970 [compost metagenome]